MKGLFHRNDMFGAVSFIIALCASVSLFIHLNGLMSTSRFPPGPGAAPYYKVIAQGSEAEHPTSQEVVLQFFISFIMHVSGVDPLSAVKIASMLISGLLPLSTYLLASDMTKSRLVGIGSAWLVAFMPAATAPIMVGDYSLTLGFVFFSLFLAFLTDCFEKGSSRTLVSALLWAALTGLTNVAMAPIMFLALAVLSFFALRNRRHIAINRLLFLSLSSIVLPVLAPLVFRPPLRVPNPVFRIDPAIWTEDFGLSLIIAVCAAAGVYVLSKRVKPAVLWVLLGTALASFIFVFIPFLSSLHLLSAPILAILAASPLLRLRDSVSVSKAEPNEDSSPESQDETVVEVVIDVSRFAPVILTIILLVSTVWVGYGASSRIFDRNSFSEYFTYEEMSSAAEWINENLPKESVLSSISEIAAWLEGFSGRRFIGSRGQSEALISDAIGSTSFRILTPSLLVDEWEPLSALKAPCISYYDGQRYTQIGYVDDSLSGAKLLEDGRVRFERLSGSVHGGYRWLSGSPPEIVLAQYFETPGLLIEKTVTVSTTEPWVKVRYHVVPKPDVELIGFDLYVRLEPFEEMETLNAASDEVVLTIGGEKTTIVFTGDIVNLTHEEHDKHRATSQAEFKARDGAVEAEVALLVDCKERSRMPLWLAYTPDLIRSNGIEYVVARSGGRGFLDRMLSSPEVWLIMDEASNSVVFDDQGNTRVEASCNGTMLFDRSPADGVRSIGYETDSLLVNKTVVGTDRSVEVRYTICPKKNQLSLASMNLTVWMGPDIPLVDYTILGNTARLKLRYGEVEVSFEGDLMYTHVVFDPSSGQTGIRAVLALQNERGEVGVKVSSIKSLLFEYEAHGEVTIYAPAKIFTEVYRQDSLVVCRTNP